VKALPPTAPKQQGRHASVGSMTRTPELQRIEATLGRTFSVVRPLPDGSALYLRLPNHESGHTMATQIEEHCLRWNTEGYTVFVGMLSGDRHYGIFALPNVDPVRLMEIFEVGRHNDFGIDAAGRAARYMRALYETDRFVPYFIDPAGVKVRFVERVSVARAGEIEASVLDFDPDAYEFANQEAILREQKLALWWD
jgi:hypothetical protein